MRLGRRSLAVGRSRDAQGKIRLVFPVPSWEDFLVLAFDEIRFYGASSIQVMRRMRALLQDLMEYVPPERRTALQNYLERVDKGIRRSFEDVDDRKDALEEDRQGLGLAREPDAVPGDGLLAPEQVDAVLAADGLVAQGAPARTAAPGVAAAAHSSRKRPRSGSPRQRSKLEG